MFGIHSFSSVIQFFTLAVVLSFHSATFASESLDTGIYAVEGPYNSVEAAGHLKHVLSERDGRVYTYDSSILGLDRALNLASNEGWLVRLSLSEDRDRIESAELLQPKESAGPSAQESHQGWNVDAPFQPTLLATQDDAKRLFGKLWNYTNTDLNDNCFNRAHIWGRYMQMAYGYNSMKSFLLFTRRYRIQFNYKWWFHVAPFVYVQGSPQHQEVVLDPSFLNEPIPLGKWVYRFAKHASRCIFAESFEQFKQVDNTEYCVSIRRSMYYYTPYDLSYGVQLPGWRCQDLRKGMTAMPAPASSGNWGALPGYLPQGCY